MATRARIVEGDGDPRHGTNNGYGNLRCRCQACRDAWAAFCAQRKELRRAEVLLGKKLRPHPQVAQPAHGTASCYGNWGCRCSECRAAWSEACRRWYPHRYAKTVAS